MFVAPTRTLGAGCCQPGCSVCTDGAYAVAQEPLVLANGEANSGRRERWGQPQADDAMGQQSTRGRRSQAVLTWALVLHCPCRASLSVPAASHACTGHNPPPMTHTLGDQE